MDSSFLSGFSDSSSRPLLEYSIGDDGSNNHDIVSMFKTDGFNDFELDLTCLSEPPSPLLEVTPIPSSDHEALALAAAVIPRRSPSMKSLSFFPSKRDSTTPSPKMTPMDSSLRNSSTGGPLPLSLVKYVGRGTPIDPTRRIEWSGPTVSDSGVNEHGVLFSAGHRSHSLDGVRRSQECQWQQVRTIPSTISGGTPRALSPLLQLSLDISPLEVLPESSTLQIRGIVESDPDEWSSVMDTVMKSSGEAVRDDDDDDDDGAPPPPKKEPEPEPESTPARDFGIFDTAVDLGLGLGLGNGMNFFNLGLAPGTSDIGHHHHHHRAGRDTPSVYSTAPPTPSPTTSIAPKDDLKKGAPERQQIDDDESTADVDSPAISSGKYVQDHHRAQWWKKLFAQLRKLHMILRARQA